MSNRQQKPCATCQWSRDLGRGIVACANEDALCFRQIRNQSDTCRRHVELSLLDKAERITGEHQEDAA